MMRRTNHTLLLNIMARLYPPPPVATFAPIAGDMVTFRSGGKVCAGTVFYVAIGDFDEPEYFVFVDGIGLTKVLRYSLTGLLESRVAA